MIQLLRTFIRAQLASVIATVFDFSTLVICVERLHFAYQYATAVGALLGAITNFLIGRYWSFRVPQDSIRGQAWRYSLVAGSSLGLNVGGVIFFTEEMRLQYWQSKLVTSCLVGVFFNFTLHRLFVFRRPSNVL